MVKELQCPSCHEVADVEHIGESAGREFYRCTKSVCPPKEFRIEYIYEELPKASIQCPSCLGENVRKFGKKQGKQIYKCNDAVCPRTTFRQEYARKAYDARVAAQIAELARQGNSARSISRMLSVSKDTVIKKREEK